MLWVDVPDTELFDEETSSFTLVKGARLQLEHSLVSLSKWESKWKKPFLKEEEKTMEELRDYIRCMTITQNVRPEVYKFITPSIFKEVDNYINDSMTATWFKEDSKKGPKGRIVTSELIYYWMTLYKIPFECEKWHLNRLLTLIRVCGAETNAANQTGKRKNRRDIAAERTALNESRLKKLGTKG